MKRTKKLLIIVAVVVALAAIFIVSASAANPTTTDNSVTFKKDVRLLNAVDGTYYGPNVTYTYSVAPASSTDLTNAKIMSQDNSEVLANILAGPAASVSFSSTTANETTGSIVYESNPQPFSQSGTAYTKTASLYFDTAKFTAPGVYRYVITDTTPVADLYAAGIVRESGYIDKLYLDVFVINGDTAGTFKISSASIVTSTGPYGNTSAGDTSVTSSKTEGFVFEGASSDRVADRYRTVNIRVTKTVTGNMGDKNHEFPFTIDIANNPTGTTNMNYYVGKGTGTTAPADFTLSNANANTVKLKHGETYFIRGLNVKATVNATETNDTAETYKVTIAGKTSADQAQGTTLKNKIDVVPNGTITVSDSGQLPITDYAENNTAANVSTTTTNTTARELDFENNCAAISPTGVVLRYAPFALMLACAGAVLIVGRKHRESKKESDQI